MLTEQEVFDKVVDRLMDGTGPAFAGTQEELKEMVVDHPIGSLYFDCQYLTEDGLKCAVGIFLPDNKDMQSYEGDAYGLVRAFGDHPDFPLEIVKYKPLLEKLQIIHDKIDNWKYKKFVGSQELKRIAKEFNLNYSG